METDSVLQDKISKIDAWQIELIGLAIVNQILPNLGSDGKARVEQRVLEMTGKLAELSMFELATLMVAPFLEIKEKDPLRLSKEKLALFGHALLVPVRQAITQALSIPIDFLDRGLRFQLSETVPTKILEESAEKIGIKITADDVPFNYCITLNLDKGLSHKYSTLVFSLTQTCGGAEFSKRFYSIEKENNRISKL